MLLRSYTITGRWPVKSAKFLRGLLKNAEANAVANELDPEDLVIRNIVVQQAPVSRISGLHASFDMLTFLPVPENTPPHVQSPRSN